ncbi:MAG: OmpA family protein [Flavobacteriales bacterium]|nr:OmpA family protein [Flavobacteriales bacterium]
MVNTNDFDSNFGISAKGDYGYLVRYTHSYGEGDIFQIPLDKELQPDPVVLILGKVYNAITKEPMSAEIIYEFLPDGTTAEQTRAAGGAGDYKIVLPYGSKYGFSAKAKGFYPQSNNIDLIAKKEYAEITRDLYLVPIEKGAIVKLNNIFFNQGSANVIPSSIPELERMVEMLIENPAVKIEIACYTDNVGSTASNLSLSKDRASAIVAYLVSKKVLEDNLTTKGYGETKPIDTNAMAAGRANNNKIVMKITEK